MPKFVILSPEIRNEAVAQNFKVVKIRNEAWLEYSKKECKQTMENSNLGKRVRENQKLAKCFFLNSILSNFYLSHCSLVWFSEFGQSVAFKEISLRPNANGPPSYLY